MLKLPLLHQPPQPQDYQNISAPLVFRLKTVTPMFMAGAHNVLANHRRGIQEDYQADLHEASFRGALRYWYRAWQGAYVGNNVDDLKQAEAVFWGSTVTGSPLALELDVHDWVTGSRPMLVHGANPRIYVNNTIVEADISFIFRGYPQWGSGQKTALTNVVQLLCELGGVGKRSRRGFGSLRVVELDGVKQMPAPNGLSKLAELKRLINGLTSPTLNPGIAEADYPILHSNHCKIMFCKRAFQDTENGGNTVPGYIDAMKACWNLMRQREDYRDHWVFGNANRDLDPPRLASPVRFNIVRSQSGYHILLTTFKTSINLEWNIAQMYLEEMGRKHDGEYVLGEGATWL